MSKILATQLNGLYQKIVQNEEESIEQTARLLAQASVGEGNVYFACFDELQAIELYALNSEEQPFSKLSKWTPDVEIQEADRVLIFAKSAQHPEALQLAKKLYDEFIPFAVVAGEAASDDNEMSNLAYTYISTHVRGGLIPIRRNWANGSLFPICTLPSLFMKPSSWFTMKFWKMKCNIGRFYLKSERMKLRSFLCQRPNSGPFSFPPTTFFTDWPPSFPFPTKADFARWPFYSPAKFNSIL